MAHVDFFLKIEGIPGESADAKHKDDIQVESFSFGVSNAGTGHAGGGHGAGKAAVQDFHFVMTVNKASPKLFLACANGEHFKSATVIARKAGKTPQSFLKWTFSDCLVSSFQTGGSGSSDVIPLDQVSLNFAKLEQEYKEQKADGSLSAAIKTGWDLKSSKAT